MVNKKIREKFLKKAKQKIKKEFMSRDMLLGKISKSIDTYNEIIHLMKERLDELMELYFPEFREKDLEKYLKIVEFIDKKDIDVKRLEKIIGKERAEKIANRAKNSVGADLNEEDLKQIRSLAKEIQNLLKLREKYEKYEEKLANEVCKNITYITNASIASKLIAHVGSLKKLALLPASTIQVLGAEKALFKHLRNKKIKPPKYGIIFQLPIINSAPKKQRGKIARLIATKIALAARADAFTKHFIGDILKKRIEERLKEIRKN